MQSNADIKLVWRQWSCYCVSPCCSLPSTVVCLSSFLFLLLPRYMKVIVCSSLRIKLFKVSLRDHACTDRNPVPKGTESVTKGASTQFQILNFASNLRQKFLHTTLDITKHVEGFSCMQAIKFDGVRWYMMMFYVLWTSSNTQTNVR